MASVGFRRSAQGVLVPVRLTPKASASRIAGTMAGPAGECMLRVSVCEAPEAGKANAALLRLLAKAWKLPKTSLSIVSGATSRRKLVLVSGDPDALIARLEKWERTLP